MNGKQKGSAFERDICRKLSLWVTDGQKVDVFWRSAMSGGRATIARARNRVVRQAGDITAVAPEGHVLDGYYIDCKFYKDLNIASFLLVGKGKLASFWRRTVKDSYHHSRQPWLIAKQNHGPPILVAKLDDETIKRLIRKHPGWADEQPACTTHIDGNPCQVWLLDILLKLKWRPAR